MRWRNTEDMKFRNTVDFGWVCFVMRIKWDGTYSLWGF